ncbi:transmembrane amino acid transporter protein-domain-containing protein [Dichomitus squalens]|nr:transmembrane amino acid transporter protein-domain-containing protein [Dichomitus squalens]
MSSIPAAIISGSYQSASNVIDAFESYRRAQSHHSDFISGSVSSSSLPSSLPHDAEAGYEDEDDLGDEWEHRSRERRRYSASGDDAILENVEWDDDLTPAPSSETRQYDFPTADAHRIPPADLEVEQDVPTPRAAPGEHTPLLVRASSSSTSLGRRAADQSAPSYAAVQRKISSASVRSKAPEAKYHVGQSTFTQTLLNAVGALFGIGMLSEPFAFACAGWIGGTILIIGYGLVSCYTAKILARIVLEDPRIRSYADIGRKAFGPRSMPLISLIFGLELFTVTVALVTLYADSLLIPAVLLPLSVLSYASIIGIFSLMAIMGIILFDGFTKFDSPGSLWSPADTSLGIDSYRELGIAFGLFMAGFAGHAIIPTLAKDMADPSRFDEMIDWAFIIATGIYGLLGVTGYIMFGNAVSDEFSMDLMKYNAHPALNSIALWGLVLTPLSKFALTSRPLNITIEMFLGIDAGSDLAPSAAAPAAHKTKAVLVAVERMVLALLAVAVSILVPQFASVMAVLGATFSFLLCIIGPLAAQIALRGRNARDGALLAVAVGMALWGTFCAFETAVLEAR